MKKKGWERKKFEDCIELVKYTNKILSKNYLLDGNYPIVSQEKALINGYWNDESDIYKVNKPIVVFGDHTKVIKYIDFDFVLGADGVKLLHPKSFINSKYLYYFIHSIKLGDLGYARHYRLLKEYSVPFPNEIKEQEEIVKKLDKGFELIDRLKENAEKNLENAKELFQSALREELSPKKGWETKKLKEIGNATTGQTPPTKDKDNFGDFIPFVKPADFLNGKLDYNNDGLSEKGMKYSRISEKGATLMVCIGATIGKTAFTEQNVTSNQQINSIYPNKDFFPKYIYYLLISKDFYNQVLKNASQATLPIINKSKWENLSVSFPSNIKQQEEIVTKLDKIKAMCEELEENYKKSVLLCEELKQGLLREVFED